MVVRMLQSAAQHLSHSGIAVSGRGPWTQDGNVSITVTGPGTGMCKEEKGV